MQPQDPKFIILNALIQGATPAVSKIVSDAYNLLKSRIQKKIKDNPDAQDTFNQFQANPDANYLAMGDVLEQTGVTHDQMALNQAQAIIFNINNINNIASGQGSSITQGSGKARIGPDTRTNNPWFFVLLGVLVLIGIVTYLFFLHGSSLFQNPPVVSKSMPPVDVKTPTPTSVPTPTPTSVPTPTPTSVPTPTPTPSVPTPTPTSVPTPTPTPSVPTPTPTSVPIDTMKMFCDKISFSDEVYQMLYSSTLKGRVTPQQFNNEWSWKDHPLSSCIPTISSNSETTGTLAVTRAFTDQNQVYNFTLIKEDGLWKINGLQLEAGA
jgi:hypothetical protein